MSIEEKLVAALQAIQGKDLVIHTIAPITHSNLINLELPVFVKDGNAGLKQALRLLGGVKPCYEGLSKDDKEEPFRGGEGVEGGEGGEEGGVKLCLRPEAANCKPIRGIKQVTSNLLMKITSVASGEQPSLCCGNVGIINRTYTFPGLADYVYISPKDPTIMLDPTGQPTGINFPLEYEESIHIGSVGETQGGEGEGEEACSVPIDIQPRLFTFHDAPLDYDKMIQKPARVASSAEEIKSFDSFIGFMDETPRGNTKRNLPLSTDSEVLAVVEVLKSLFKENPVWTKQNITLKIAQETRHKIKFAFPHVSYSFRNGPFRFLRIMYGVDPRQDRFFARYQSLDIRFRGGYITHLLKKSKDSTLDLKILGYPFKQQIIMNLYDLMQASEEVTRVMDEADYNEVCDFQSGWLKADTKNILREIIAKEALRLAVETGYEGEEELTKVVAVDIDDSTLQEDGMDVDDTGATAPTTTSAAAGKGKGRGKGRGGKGSRGGRGKGTRGGKGKGRDAQEEEGERGGQGRPYGVPVSDRYELYDEDSEDSDTSL